jgi:hypothetical protein
MNIFSFYAALCVFACSTVCSRSPVDDRDDSQHAAILSSEQYVETAREKGLALIPVRHKPQVVSGRLLMSGDNTSSSSMTTADYGAQDSNALDVTTEILAAEENNGTGIPGEPSAALFIKTGA